MFWAFPERAVFIDNEVLVSLDNVGIWNLRAEKLDNWYRGQEVYVKVADPLGYNITEMVIPDNALYCGLLKERQKYVSAESLLTSDAMIHFTVLDLQLTFCPKTLQATGP